ncbi:hypothetical protein C8J56DRAFT_1059565 [Mycena floridula]|nr:hypothetical protein C8J56DRAFT_1059565 [Mycena floridula]
MPKIDGDTVKRPRMPRPQIMKPEGIMLTAVTTTEGCIIKKPRKSRRMTELQKYERKTARMIKKMEAEEAQREAKKAKDALSRTTPVKFPRTIYETPQPFVCRDDVDRWMRDEMGEKYVIALKSLTATIFLKDLVKNCSIRRGHCWKDIEILNHDKEYIKQIHRFIYHCGRPYFTDHGVTDAHARALTFDDHDRYIPGLPVHKQWDRARDRFNVSCHPAIFLARMLPQGWSDGAAQDPARAALDSGDPAEGIGLVLKVAAERTLLSCFFSILQNSPASVQLEFALKSQTTHLIALDFVILSTSTFWPFFGILFYFCKSQSPKEHCRVRTYRSPPMSPPTAVPDPKGYNSEEMYDNDPDIYNSQLNARLEELEAGTASKQGSISRGRSRSRSTPPVTPIPDNYNLRRTISPSKNCTAGMKTAFKNRRSRPNDPEDAGSSTPIAGPSRRRDTAAPDQSREPTPQIHPSGSSTPHRPASRLEPSPAPAQLGQAYNAYGFSVGPSSYQHSNQGPPAPSSYQNGHQNLPPPLQSPINFPNQNQQIQQQNYQPQPQPPTFSNGVNIQLQPPTFSNSVNNAPPTTFQNNFPRLEQPHVPLFPVVAPIHPYQPQNPNPGQSVPSPNPVFQPGPAPPLTATSFSAAEVNDVDDDDEDDDEELEEGDLDEDADDKENEGPVGKRGRLSGEQNRIINEGIAAMDALALKTAVDAGISLGLFQRKLDARSGGPNR